MYIWYRLVQGFIIARFIHQKFENYGFTGGGKTWCMMYCILYDISKGLNVTSMPMMWKCVLQLGGIHVHQLFRIPTKANLTPHRHAEPDILSLTQKPKKNSYGLLICCPLIKWVNSQHKFYYFCHYPSQNPE